MGKCVSIHSYRGGTGKTLLATNLAVLMAKRGLNVALLDLDFRAPSLVGVFSKDKTLPIDSYLNSYFDGRCPAEAAILDLTPHYKLNGKLLVGFSDPHIAAIRNIAEKSRSWEVSAVKRLLALQTRLFKELNINYCIMDTSPGVQYTSVNAAISSDLSIIISTLDSLDIQGSQSLLIDLYDALEKKTTILLNKVFPSAINMPTNWKNDTINQAQSTFTHPVINAIPCYCDVLQTKRSCILAIEKEQHPFVRDLTEVLETLDAYI